MQSQVREYDIQLSDLFAAVAILRKWIGAGYKTSWCEWWPFLIAMSNRKLVNATCIYFSGIILWVFVWLIITGP